MNTKLRALPVLGAAAGVVLLAAGCAAGPAQGTAAGSPGQHARHIQPRTAAHPVATPRSIAVAAAASPGPASQAPAYHGPHFATPQAAMRFLATAYNKWNTAGLHAVTTPDAFKQLKSMRSEAVNLRLKSCERNPNGDYDCYFIHDYPASLHKKGHGASTMLVAPARNPGWYMYTLIECG